MKINELVNLLREASKDRENRQMFLPIEVVNVINGKKQEKSWEKISMGKVMYYLADMLEE
ncbi:MAG: hypothetical protein Q8M95_10990 [Candidatus Methanoperedens sp.]|nr:hypothetical protein [Candidatus Methanoperedens sp.]